MNKRWVVLGIAAPTLAVLLGAGWWKSESISPETSTVVSNPAIEVYKNPQCGCCGEWVSHLRAQGFAVTVHDVSDTIAIREKHRVPVALGSCHTATIEGYVVEGHVSAADIRRLLKEKPAVVGLAVPGMPAGSPGMESSSPQAYQTLALLITGATDVFADHPAVPMP